MRNITLVAFVNPAGELKTRDRGPGDKAEIVRIASRP